MMNGSIGESIMRAAIREYLGPMVAIIKTRVPIWLKGLELDCYNPDLRFAFEYQGIQHYERVPLFQPNEGDFEAQQTRDILKRIRTTKAHVALIEIPYTVPRAAIRDRVRRELYYLGFDPVAEPIPYTDFIKQVMETETRAAAMLAQAREIAISHGGECLSTVYVDCHEELDFRCKFGHLFSAQLARVGHATHARPRFCRECGGTRLRTFEENKADVERAGYILVEMDTVFRGKVKKKSVVLMCVTCPARTHTYWVERANFLPLDADLRPVRNCRSCARIHTGYLKGLASCEQMCAAFDLQALTPYVGRHDRMDWKCLKCGDEFNLSCNTMYLRQGGKCQKCKGKKN
jgi:hypothetical protein